MELARSFAFASIALAEKLGSSLKLSGSRRRSFELANERHQGSELFLVQFFDTERLLSPLILQDFLVGLTTCSSGDIHAASAVSQVDLPQGDYSRSKQTSPRPPHHHEPRLRPALAEADVLEVWPNLEPCRLDGLDLPALSERVLNLSS
jgi:hypothetical protein